MAGIHNDWSADMQVATGGYAASVDEVATAATRAERLAYDGWWSSARSRG